MAIGCASNNTAAGNTAAGRESPRVLWLTRPGCCSIVSLPSLSKSRIWIENGQKGPHAADKSCSCLIESRSRSVINRPWRNDQRIDPRRSRPLPPRVGWYGRASDQDLKKDLKKLSKLSKLSRRSSAPRVQRTGWGEVGANCPQNAPTWWTISDNIAFALDQTAACRSPEPLARGDRSLDVR